MSASISTTLYLNLYLYSLLKPYWAPWEGSWHTKVSAAEAREGCQLDVLMRRPPVWGLFLGPSSLVCLVNPRFPLKGALKEI